MGAFFLFLSLPVSGEARDGAVPGDGVAEGFAQVTQADVDGAGAVFAAQCEGLACDLQGDLWHWRRRWGIGAGLGAELGDVGVDLGEKI